MVNRSQQCEFCYDETVYPVKYRAKNANRSWTLAFLACSHCYSFYDFLRTNHKAMPYYNDMSAFTTIKPIKTQERLRLKEIHYKNYPCIGEESKGKLKDQNEPKKHEYTKMWLEVERDKTEYFGYLCKDCKTFYAINSKFVNLPIRKEKGLPSGYVGKTYIHQGFAEPKDAPVTVSWTFTPNDLKKLKQIMRKKGIKPITDIIEE